jgi:hypothetical protein
MRNPLPFDTHAYVKRLTAAGVPEAQAEVHAEALSEIALAQLATKDDVHQVKEELRQVETSVKAELQAAVQALRGEMRESELRGSAKLESELRKQLVWFVGILLAWSGVLLAVARLLLIPRG